MLSRILYIDLTTKKKRIVRRPELFDRFLGGDGVAIKLLQEEGGEGVAPLSPEAPIIFSIGPLTSMFPCCTKVVSMFKSPLTGNLGESHAGGRLGLAMRLANYGAIVVKGQSASPVYVSIHDDEVAIKDATTLWGMSTYSTGRVLREIEPGRGRRSIIRIGPAGERGVRFANVNVDTYRHFGRLGLGAVFGSKRLKAIVISGKRSLPIKQIEEYRRVYEKIHREVTRTDVMKKYHDMGTAENVLPLNELRAFPTRNLAQSQFEHAEEISGERLAETYLTRKMACVQCPLGCIHIATLRIPFAAGHEYESLFVPYDYEPIYALGSMLGIGSPNHILELIERVERNGLDAISSGVILAWATEAYKRGLITLDETAGIALDWGDVDNYIKMIEELVTPPNEFFNTLTLGVEAVAQRYGGLDFALALGKNEVAGYHCGPATVLGQLFGCRHSHLDNAGYSIDQKALRKPMSPEQMVEALIKEEQWRCLLTTLVICFFARGVYTGDVLVEALKSIGIKRSQNELKKLGEEIFREKFAFKLQEGFRLRNLRIPKRFFETPSACGKLDEKLLQNMVRLYAKKVGVK